MKSLYITCAFAGSNRRESMSTQTDACFSLKSSGRSVYGIRWNQSSFISVLRTWPRAPRSGAGSGGTARAREAEVRIEVRRGEQAHEQRVARLGRDARHLAEVARSLAELPLDPRLQLAIERELGRVQLLLVHGQAEELEHRAQLDRGAHLLQEPHVGETLEPALERLGLERADVPEQARRGHLEERDQDRVLALEVV